MGSTRRSSRDSRMRDMKRNLITMLAGITLALVPLGPALAQPDNSGPQGEAGLQVQSLQAQADAIRKEMAALDHELVVVIEKHNATRVYLDMLAMELADSRQRLDSMLAQRDAQEKVLTQRLAAVYKAGEINFMSILLNSRSLSDFFEQTRYIARISEQDAKLEEQFRASAETIETLTEEIDNKRSEQLRLERDLEEQKALIESRIAEREARLGQVDGQVQEILRQEEARQRAEQERAAAEAAALLQGLGISDAVQAQVVQTALQYLGVPYVWGGESPAGFDCSGLTKYVFARHGVSLPHNAAMQFGLGVPVPANQLQPGDLLFWGPGSPYHVGMYIGGGKFIEAPTFNQVVKISNLVIDNDFAGAKRYPLRAR